MLDRDLYEIRRAGYVLRVEPKVFDLLVYLFENRHRVVTKAELLATVWNGRSVVDSVVPRAVCLARKIIGDESIETRHGRGYRFVEAAVTARTTAQSLASRATESGPNQNLMIS